MTSQILARDTNSRLIKAPGRALLYALGVLGLGRHDILLASFPRSGSTWVRFMLCNLISLLEWDGLAVGFALLNRTMVELGANNLLTAWPHSSIPRVVKTHKCYWPVFARAHGSIGVVRDPRDVMVSSFHFQRDRQRSYSGDFASFIRNQDFGLPAWFRHYTSWQAHWSLLVRYEDMRNDTYRELCHILSVLDVHCPEGIVREAISRSSIGNVRSIEASSERPRDRNAQFARDGSSQQWRAYFGTSDLAYYDALAVRYAVRIYSGGQDTSRMDGGAEQP